VLLEQGEEISAIAWNAEQKDQSRHHLADETPEKRDPKTPLHSDQLENEQFNYRRGTDCTEVDYDCRPSLCAFHRIATEQKSRPQSSDLLTGPPMLTFAALLDDGGRHLTAAIMRCSKHSPGYDFAPSCLETYVEQSGCWLARDPFPEAIKGDDERIRAAG